MHTGFDQTCGDSLPLLLFAQKRAVRGDADLLDAWNRGDLCAEIGDARTCQRLATRDAHFFDTESGTDTQDAQRMRAAVRIEQDRERRAVVVVGEHGGGGVGVDFNDDREIVRIAEQGGEGHWFLCEQGALPFE